MQKGITEGIFKVNIGTVFQQLFDANKRSGFILEFNCEVEAGHSCLLIETICDLLFVGREHAFHFDEMSMFLRFYIA